MKETVYGNYPPARDPWTTYRSKENTYDTECLYKYIASKYNGRSGVSSAKVTTPLQLSGTAYDFAQSVQTMPRPRRAEIPDMRRRPKSFRPLGACPGSRPASVHSGQRSFEKQHQKPVVQTQRQNGRVIELQIDGRRASAVQCRSSTVATPISTKPGSSQLEPWAAHVQREASQIPEPPTKAAVTTHTRIRSAYVPRPKQTPPKRPAKSADPRYRIPDGHIIHNTEKALTLEDDDLQSTVEMDGEGSTIEVSEDDTDSVSHVDKPLDYDEELKKYGWKMEIPGDPLNIKQPCLPKRLPYTVVIPSRPIPPDPPKVHIEAVEPFFSNTIPRGPLTFTVHKDWSSEVLMSKRLELQKRDGEKYKYRQNHFSFLY